MTMATLEQPYLSVVVTTRNDDHGGHLLRRTQTFVNALVAQLKRFELPAELIVVEWNPPGDRPPLRDALRWPSLPSHASVRLIQVPPAVHSSYRNAQTLPLYQMIAKNVGIRRAKGQFVLATNIDILFSDELMAFLAQRSLSVGSMYRIDRHDAMTDVPVDAPVEEQLAYCSSHLLRVNSQGGTFAVGPRGEPTPSPDSSRPEPESVSVSAGGSRSPGFFAKVAGVLRRAAEDGPVIQVWVPIPGPVRRILRSCLGLPAYSPASAPDATTEVSTEVSPDDSNGGTPPVHLHTNACGDFTLMAKSHWLDLRGYPEWDLYSLHIDSVLCHAAHNAGAREVLLREPMRIYHIEHGQGSGWTPEGEKQLFQRLKEKGISWFEHEDLVRLAAQMRRLECPMIFNRENWGLAEYDLPEVVVPSVKT